MCILFAFFDDDDDDDDDSEGGLVVYWLDHQTCDQQVTSFTPGHALPG